MSQIPESLSTLFEKKQTKTMPAEYLTTLTALLLKTAGVFQRELSAAIQATYIEQLSDLPLDRIRIGFDAALKRCKRMPTISEIRDLANEKSTEAVTAPAHGQYCGECYPDGWVLHTTPYGYKWAKRCECQGAR